MTGRLNMFGEIGYNKRCIPNSKNENRKEIPKRGQWLRGWQSWASVNRQEIRLPFKAVILEREGRDEINSNSAKLLSRQTSNIPSYSTNPSLRGETQQLGKIIVEAKFKYSKLLNKPEFARRNTATRQNYCRGKIQIFQATQHPRETGS